MDNTILDFVENFMEKTLGEKGEGLGLEGDGVGHGENGAHVVFGQDP